MATFKFPLAYMGRRKIGLYCYLTRYFDKSFTEMFFSSLIVAMATERLNADLKLL